MKKIIFFLLLSVCFKAYAQDSSKAGTIQDLSQQGTVGAMAVQVQIGTQGIGADFRYGFLPNLSARFGFSTIPVTVDNAFTFHNFPSDNKLEAKFFNLHALADYVPFDNSMFRIVGGVAYFFRADGEAVATPTGTYKYGDIPLTGAEVGTLTLDASWKGVAPYLGVGILKSFPDKLFSVNFDVGSYYLTKTGGTIVGTNLLSDNYTQDAQFDKNLQSYHWLPVVQVNLNFNIDKLFH